MAFALKVPTIFTAVDKFSGTLFKMGDNLSKYQRKAKGLSESSGRMSRRAGIVALAIAAPLAIVANSAIKFQDRLADISKTTGLMGVELDRYGASILSSSKKTRSGIDDLLTIGEIGGQLGVATKELIKFTDAANVFNVALGADYGGVEEAISQVGKIKNLFQETRKLDISSVITKAGSAINTLSATGTAKSSNINDFILRIGQLPDAIKPSLQNTAALGTYFEEVGIDAQIAAGGLSNFYLIAGKNIGAFAKQIGISKDAAKSLLATDPTAFALRFAVSLNKLSPDALSKKLNKLKIGTLETIKTISSLGKGTERLTYLQGEAAKAFEAGTSLTNEYNTKNNSLAGRIKQAQNNFEAFSITLGTDVLPIVSKLLDQIMPVIGSIVSWVEKNPELTTTILEVAAGISAFLGVVSVISGVVSAVTGVMWLFNIAMAANPIGIFIAMGVALVALITTIIAKWDEWGAAIAVFLGPLGLIISFIKELYDNWGMVTEAFEKGGIWGAIKAIGKIFLSAILHPAEKFLSIIGSITGWDWAKNAAKSLYNVRDTLGVDMTGSEEDKTKAPIAPPLFTAQLREQREARAKADEQNKDMFGKLGIEIYDPNGNVKRTTQSGTLQPTVKLTSTQGVR
jgi:TP901 family phage tail tape measure protein